jgi:hypothetical protein
MPAPIKSKTEGSLSRVPEDLNKLSTQDETPTTKVPVVRTLKPPPEIWELVHPVPPRQLTPARAFVARLASSRSMFIFLAGVIVFIGVYVGLRSGKRIAGVRNAQVVPAKQVDTTKTGVGDSNKTTLEHNAPDPGVASTVDQPTDVGGSENLPRKSSRRVSKPIGAVTQVDNGPAVTETTTAIKTGSSPQRSQVSQPTGQKVAIKSLTNATETAKDDSSDAGSANRKSKTTLSTQLIDSPKTSTPRKAKVINWP